MTMDHGSPGSGPGSSPHGPDVQRVESLTDTLPSPVIDHSHSATLVASQLQVNISFHLVSMSQLIPYSCCLVAWSSSSRCYCSRNRVLIRFPLSHCQPQPRALQSGLWLKALHLLLALKGLVCSFPWVQQVLQLQRSLLRSFGSATQVNIQIFPCHSPRPMSICACFHWTVPWECCCID